MHSASALILSLAKRTIFHQAGIIPPRSHMTNEPHSKANLHILVGIPGCGKSTFARRLGCSVISSDGIRERLCGDITDQSKNDLVFKAFHNTIGWALREGRSVVADSTALDRRARKTLADIAEQNHAETHLYLFANPFEALMRNRTRERRVPDNVMTRMLEKYERTLLLLPQEQYTSVTKIGSLR